MLVQRMFDLRVLLGTMAFVKSSIPVWRESVRHLQFFCSFLPVSFLIHQRRLLYWKKCLFSNNMIIQTLARCCFDNIGALCDIYKFNVKDLVDLPAYHLKCMIWDVLAVCCDPKPNYVFIHFCSFCSFYCILTVFYCIVRLWFLLLRRNKTIIILIIMHSQ